MAFRKDCGWITTHKKYGKLVKGSCVVFVIVLENLFLSHLTNPLLTPSFHPALVCSIILYCCGAL